MPMKASAAGVNQPNATNKANNNIPAEIMSHKAKQYDSSLTISVKTVLYKLKQKQPITLIDIRGAREFERLKISGSINIPLYAVKTKSFLKPLSIVLIDKGFGYSKLEAEGRRLAELGFKVSILDGGLPAWKRKGGQLVGDLFALDDMKTVSPRVFFREKDYESLLAVDFSPQRTEASSRLIPCAKHVPLLDDTDGSMLELRQLVSKYKNKSFFSVLIFNASGKQYANAEKYLNRMGLDAFYLQSGLDGYHKYLEGLRLSWKPRDSRVKTVSICKPCGGKSEAGNFQTGK
jgi:rhodanese-related sulfurtransferase